MATKKPKGFNPLPYPNPQPDFGPNTPKSERNKFRRIAEKKQKAVVKSRDVAKAKAAAPKATPKATAKATAKTQQLSKAKNYATGQRLKSVGTPSLKAPSSSVSAAPPRTGASGGGSSGGSLYSRITGGGLRGHGK